LADYTDWDDTEALDLKQIAWTRAQINPGVEAFTYGSFYSSGGPKGARTSDMTVNGGWPIPVSYSERGVEGGSPE
jgi:hypothetical protein